MTTRGKIALFIGGTLFGSAGFKLLSSRDAKKAYTHLTAAALRCKDEVMRNVELMQENCSDILADAKEINARRKAAEEAEIIGEKGSDAKNAGNLTKQKTIIMIAHRLKTVRNADQIFVIDNGRIAQRGTHEELLRQDGIYKRFVEGRREAASWKIA